MGNLGGGELLVILVLGLLVLGPARLGVVAQQIGRLVGQVRRMAGGFQAELRDLVADPFKILFCIPFRFFGPTSSSSFTIGMSTCTSKFSILYN